MNEFELIKRNFEEFIKKNKLQGYSVELSARGKSVYLIKNLSSPLNVMDIIYGDTVYHMKKPVCIITNIAARIDIKNVVLYIKTTSGGLFNHHANSNVEADDFGPVGYKSTCAGDLAKESHDFSEKKVFFSILDRAVIMFKKNNGNSAVSKDVARLVTDESKIESKEEYKVYTWNDAPIS